MRALKMFPLLAVILPLSAVVGLLAGVALGDRMTSTAEAATASNLTLLYVREDIFANEVNVS